MHDLVVGRTQQRMPGEAAEAGAVDQLLRMLDAHADGKRLRRHGNAARTQHGETVARAVAQGEDDMIGVDGLAICQRDAAHAALAVGCFNDIEIVDTRAEAVFAAQRFDGGTQAFHHRHQPEGADMRLADEQDFLGRAGADEFLQHLAAQMMRVLDAGIQLAVGKGAGAAFAELHIAFRVQHTAPPQAPGVAGAFAHQLAAFQDDRPEAHLREDQRGEQPARAASDHHRAARQTGRSMRHRAVLRIRRRGQPRIAGAAAQHGGFVAQRHIDAVDQPDRRAPPRVVAAPCHRQAGQIGRIEFQALQHSAAQIRLRMIQRQLQFGQPEHRALLPRLVRRGVAMRQI